MLRRPPLCHNRLTIPVCFHAHNCLVSASLSFSILISPSSSGLVGRDGQSSTGCLPRRRCRCKRGPAQSVGRARVEVKVFEKSSLSAMRISSARYLTNVNFITNLDLRVILNLFSSVLLCYLSTSRREKPTLSPSLSTSAATANVERYPAALEGHGCYGHEGREGD